MNLNVPRKSDNWIKLRALRGPKYTSSYKGKHVEPPQNNFTWHIQGSYFVHLMYF
jgi:hypothetical protein